MPDILVSALVTDGARALLGRRRDGGWELPTETLGASEDTDEAFERVLEAHLELAGCAGDFLATYYEHPVDGADSVVRNVYRVADVERPPRLPETSRYAELRWVSPVELGAFGATESLRCVLQDGLAQSAEEAPAGAPIIILAGPPAAGKSTIAGALCRRLERAAHVEVDLLRHMIVAGYASPLPGGADPIAAAEQIVLAKVNAAALARNFSLAGYTVEIDDVMETAESLDRLLDAIGDVAEISLVTLLPGEEVLRIRDSARETELQMGNRCLELHSILQSNGETRGLRLDNSDMTPQLVAEWILDNRELARVFVGLQTQAGGFKTRPYGRGDQSGVLIEGVDS